MITAFYDFAASPASYDVVQFLAGARAFAGRKPLHVVLVPGVGGSFKPDRKQVSPAHKRWRVTHIVLPAIRAAGATFTVCPTREFANRFECDYPVGASILKPVRAHTIDYLAKHGPCEMKASEAAGELVDRWLEGRRLEKKPLVTVTLRNTYTATRNSSTGWLLLPELFPEYDFVMVPDFDRIWGPSYGNEFPHAAMDLDIRLALYDRAVMNAGTAGGPMTLCMMTRRPYLVFHPVYPDKKDGFRPTAEKMAEWGFPVGSQFKWATQKQRIVWEHETPERIETEFVEIMQ